MEKKLKTKNLGSILSYVTLVFMFIVILVCSLTSTGLVSRSSEESTIAYNEGWKCEGKNISLPYDIVLAPNEEITITRVADETLYKNSNLYLQNLKMGLRVYINDEIVYALNDSSLKNTLIVNCQNLVELNDVKIGDSVSITFINLNDTNYETFLPTIKIGTRDAINHLVLQSEAVTSCCIALTVLLGIVFISFAIIAFKKNVMQKRFISFGLFILDVAIWLITDSAIMCLFPVNLEIVGIISYFAFMCIPLGILFFMKRSFKEYQYLPLLNANVAVVLINIVVQGFLMLFQVIPINRLVLLDQIILLVSTLVCIIYTIKFSLADRKNIQPKILMGDLIMVLAFGACACICYYMYTDLAYHLIIAITIVLFVFGLIMIMIHSHYAALAQKEVLIKESERFKELSYKDEQTGLGNTRAFNEELSNIEFNGSDAYLFIIDVNNLKRVNDTYGHGAGDVIINQCAECLNKVISPFNGKNFRIGGDEFAVIIYENYVNATSLINNFNELIKATNGDRMYKLSVAVGYAKFDGVDIKTSEALKFKADLSMYHDKSNQKSRDSDEENEIWSKMVDTIVSIFEIKDPYTAQHSNRVSTIAKFIAEAMELTAVSINDVYLAGNLHDIGKIGISDKILCKRGKLTEEEFQEIRKHPEIGERIILSSGGMKKIGTIVRGHHERINGSGYPDHLKGDEIPLESRILAIADSIDAMTSDRCYRKALTYDECKAELEKNAGILYDERITKCVLSHWEEVVTIHKELKSQLN